MKVLVAGGTGFVGTAVVHALRARGVDVRVLARDPVRAAPLESLGVELARGDLTDADSLAPAVEGCTHVVNLVAIIKGSPADFERVMTRGTASLVEAARTAGVARFVQMSALGTTEQTSTLVPYYAAKWAIEHAVESSGLEYVLVRPSFVFGRGGALPTFVRQVKLSPVVAVLGPGTSRLQPVWLEDVAQFFATIVDDARAPGRTWELGGPDVATWDELYLAIAETLGKKRRLVHVPFSFARAGARLTEWIPGAPLTRDQVTMLEAGDNVCSDSDAMDTFGLELVSLRDQLRRATA
jgi:NADH dehydrogenase